MATLRRPTIDGGEMSANNALHFLALADGSSDVHSGGESPVGNSDEEAVFSYQKEFGYVDFAARKDRAKTFKIHEFTWDHGFNLLNDLIPETAQNLDDKFDLTQRLTYSFMGGYENVDTTVYRCAVWNYIHALFGIRHDDYDYAKVGQLFLGPLSFCTVPFLRAQRSFNAIYLKSLLNRLVFLKWNKGHDGCNRVMRIA
ncbi:unnamed protein product [Strongylus vulgaris]|uniref:Uncharacterized protein n=1 Tax=Strongylus vulgaris TaxID=40348 RepID=A0A3P7KML4_STRVU|nr:unnamed protein product [Strongylus vulgaris]